MVYLTVSTGLGGGIISNGKLVMGRSGLAGHFGQMRTGSLALDQPLENFCSGRWIADQALQRGYQMEAKDVFEQAERGVEWAEAIAAESARQTARLCQNIQLMLDPHCIVVGGGIGLAAGHLSRIEEHLRGLPKIARTRLIAAALGPDAGILGVADLTLRNHDGL